MSASRFRLDNDVLSFRFTATRIDRFDRPRELLECAFDVREWFGLHGLAADAVVDGDLPMVWKLREAIHRIGTALAEGGRPTDSDLDVVNSAVLAGGARRQLTAAGARRWTAGDGLTTGDVLGVLADDAVDNFSVRGDRVRVCADSACRGLFIDSSRARSRRWCSMNHCGNRNKKLTFRNPGNRAGRR